MPKINDGDGKVSINALRYSTHFGMAVPIEPLSFGNNDIE